MFFNSTDIAVILKKILNVPFNNRTTWLKMLTVLLCTAHLILVLYRRHRTAVIPGKLYQDISAGGDCLCFQRCCPI